jgi:hypothetical protein
MLRRPQSVACSFLALPRVLGALPSAPQPNSPARTLEREIVIALSPAAIWQQIHNVTDVQAEEVSLGWMYRTGVPLPIAGVSDRARPGSVRHITMGKDIHFDQLAATWEEERHGACTYRFAEASFPAGAQSACST